MRVCLSMIVRNEVLELAALHGDQARVIDADEILLAEGASWPTLDAPGYRLEFHFGNTCYRRIAVPRPDADACWRAVLHEDFARAHIGTPHRSSTLAGA